MYETYTRQSLPTKKYRELLGSALCVFSSNNSFIIENIIKIDNSYDWYTLIDKEAGLLKQKISATISAASEDTKIENLFMEIVDMRNRIIHGFRITSTSGEQVLATKTRSRDGNIQFEITEEYLLQFIKKTKHYLSYCMIIGYTDFSYKFKFAGCEKCIMCCAGSHHPIKTSLHLQLPAHSLKPSVRNDWWFLFCMIQ